MPTPNTKRLAPKQKPKKARHRLNSGPTHSRDLVFQGRVRSSWLAVQGRDGTEAYTRGGSLDVDAEGNLATSAGLTVLGDGGPIQVPPETVVSIAADGTVSATAANGRSTSIGRLKLVTPEAPLVRGSDGLFRGSDGDLAADTTAQLQDGALEGSNVSAVETMVQMIAAARQFEAQMRSLSTAEGNDKSASQLLSLS